MAERWVQDCKRILHEIKRSAQVKGRDRLEMVRLIRFTLFSLQRSVTGWMEWANNPDVMAQFSLEELKDINKNLAELVCAFVQYDAEITGHTETELRRREDKQAEEPRAKKRPERKDMFYVK